jgi:hypothetical protein
VPVLNRRYLRKVFLTVIFNRRVKVHSLIYLVGLIVIVLAVLSLLGIA